MSERRDEYKFYGKIHWIGVETSTKDEYNGINQGDQEEEAIAISPKGKGRGNTETDVGQHSGQNFAEGKRHIGGGKEGRVET